MADESHILDALVVIDDLIFETKIRSAAQAVGARVVLIKPDSDIADYLLEHRPTLLIVDLGSARERGLSAVAAARGHQHVPRILAFLPHVDTHLAEQAARDGAHDVMPRSRFSNELPKILADCQDGYTGGTGSDS